MRVEGLKVCRVSYKLRDTDLSYIPLVIYDKICMKVFECG